MNSLKDTKVVVIGGAGFIGSHLVDNLIREDVREIVIYDNFCRGTHKNISVALKDSRVKVFDLGGDILQTDILNEALKKADYVFHLAALWLLHCQDFPRSAFHVNMEGTFNVLEACVKNNVKRLIYSSSASVYGDALQIPMTEDHAFNNKTFYGATKIAGEQMARAFHHRYGLNYVGLRYMNVFGARQDYKGAYIAVIMKILDNLDQGKRPVLYGDGTQAYDFIYVEDVAKANICALKANTTDEFYNIGSGTQTTLKQLAEQILKLTNSSLEIQYEPQTQSFVTNRIGSTAKAQRDLKFKTSISLEEGLKRVIEWRNQDKSR